MSNPTEERFLFTSESVCEGHPDKLCDIVADAVLDACLAQDPNSRVACEVCTKGKMMMLFGEISTKATINYEQIARDTIKEIGYDDESKGFDYRTASILIAIDEQSPEIASCLSLNKSPEELCAGDQGIIFGYATNETSIFMPTTAFYANLLSYKLAELRKKGTFPWICPDGKTQVTMEYKIDVDRKLIPLRVHTILISVQHTKDITNEQIMSDIKEHVIKQTLPQNLLDDNTIYYINPSGKFILGGPHSDAGLTGRKIVVDTYGGWGSHGGGSFSGKDSTKVDRSGSYAARNIAISLVNSQLCDRVLVQLSYSIGVSDPLSVYIDTYGTGKKSNHELIEIVKKNYDLRPGAIIKQFGLNKPIFKKTSCYGHFGRDDPAFTWEVPTKLEI